MDRREERFAREDELYEIIMFSQNEKNESYQKLVQRILSWLDEHSRRRKQRRKSE